MTTPAQFAAKCERFVTIAPSARQDALAQSALAVKESWIVLLRGAGLPGGGRLRNVGKNGAPFTPSYKLSAGFATVNMPRAAGIVIGPTPTKPHIIGAKKYGTRGSLRTRGLGLALGRTMAGGAPAGRGAMGSLQGNRPGAKALAMPDGGFAAYVFHPGSKRRDIWPEAVAEAQRVSTATFKAAQGPALIRAGFGI